MSFTLKLEPIREVYSNEDYRTIACMPHGFYKELELNKYHNFTLSGTNLDMLEIGVEYDLEIERAKSKYEASYSLIGWNQTGEDNCIKITPEQEIAILRRIAEGSQPENIHFACPNFVQMVLDGKESEIDINNIKNVGKQRFALYVDKIRGSFDFIKFLPIMQQWGVTSQSDIDGLMKKFEHPEELEKQLELNPYHVFFDLMNYPFAKSDKYVLNHKPEYIDSVERAEFTCLEVLRQNELEGDTRIDSELLEILAEELAPEVVDLIPQAIEKSERIIKVGDYLANRGTYQAEVNIANNIKNRLNEGNFFINKAPDFELYRSIDSVTCTDEQMETLKLLWQYNVAMLSAPAGSGKTTSMKSCVKMLEDSNIEYLLLAPTGIATKRLKEATGRDEAQTVSMFITCGGKLDFNGVVVCEESSMLSVHLLSMLFNVVGPNSKFLFICDEAQLASISCGNVVQDIIDSGIMPTARLTKVFRYGTSGLTTIATDTRNGELGSRVNGNFSDYKFIPMSNKPIKQILDVYQELLDKYHKDDIMILSPYNKGNAGTVAINNAIQSRYNPNPDTKAIRTILTGEIMFKVGDKVINTHNEYNMPCCELDENGEWEYSRETIQVMNGDIGYVRQIKDKGNNKIEMLVEFDTGMACMNNSLMDNLLLGYAISVHRVQGSEAKAVIVFLSKEHQRLLTRNLAYVADSRARECLIEIGDIGAIERGLEKVENKSRETWLRELLEEG